MDEDDSMSANNASTPLDPEIEALHFAPVARNAAYLLKATYPAIKFTSGRRNVADQARAMAGNVVRNRQWIAQTYKFGPLRELCQAWVKGHPEKKTAAEIERGGSVRNFVCEAR